MNFISFLIFIPLQIIFLPLGLVGVLLVAYKQMIVSKPLGSSQTAVVWWYPRLGFESITMPNKAVN